MDVLKRLHWLSVLLLLCAENALAAEKLAATFEASRGSDNSGWKTNHDKQVRATVTFNDESLTIVDDESNGKARDAYFYRELTREERALAVTSGFVYKWTLRIPNETKQTTRAISTEVCVRDDDSNKLLRFGLQFGRRGSELLATVHRGSDGPLNGALTVHDVNVFHDWKLIFEGKTQIINLWVDGRLILKARIDCRDTGHHLVFGSRSTGEGVSEWKRLRFSVGTAGARMVVPDPSESPLFWIMAKERSSVPKFVDVFKAGVDGYFAYRIPSFITAPNGDLLVFCEARKNNLNDDGNIDLVMKRSTDGGKAWQKQELIYEEGGEARIKYGNPTALVDEETSVIWLATNRDYLTDRGSRAGGLLVLFRSNDSGKTWSKPIDISKSIRQSDWGHHAFGPGIGIQLKHGKHKGRLIYPANFRRSFDKRQPSYSHVIISDDHGKTWRRGGVLGDYTNECQIAEIVDNGKSGLLINMRNHRGRGGFPKKSGYRLVARSFDGGESWDTEKMDRALNEPPCQASLFRYSFAKNGEFSRILFANPVGPGRSNLRVRVSYDEGRTWPHAKLVSLDSAAYSCMVRLPNDRVGVIYERDNYRKIAFCEFPIRWLEKE